MLATFQSDIFSASKPRFSMIAKSCERAVREAIARFYCEIAGPVDTVLLEQFGGNEINSNNFRVTCGEMVYLLKRLPLSADAGNIKRQLALMEWLRDVHDVPLPTLLRTSNGAVLGEDGAALWCLFEFLDGDFFSGGLEQLVQTGQEIGRLQVALRRYPQALRPMARWEYFTADDYAVYQSTINRLNDWPRIFGTEVAGLLEEQIASLQQVWTELAGASAHLSDLTPAVCHCDLHPHNLLLSGSKFSGFIDFESFVTMPVEAALGFGIFKLMRQHAVATSLGIQDRYEIQNATRAFLAAMSEAHEPMAERPELLRVMALAEVFRRILVIFRLNLRDANPAWNHVLPMQLAGLHELEVIFGQNSKC